MSTEKTDLNRAEDEAKAQFDREIKDALDKKDPQERDAAVGAARRKYNNALEAALAAYLAALARARAELAEHVNKQIVNKGAKKEVNTAPIANMVALVMEAHSMDIYDSATDDCKTAKSGACTSKNEKGTMTCGQGDCKCKCHAYVRLSNQWIRAEGFIHGATFGSCPTSFNDTFGPGNIDCKCVNK